MKKQHKYLVVIAIVLLNLLAFYLYVYEVSVEGWKEQLIWGWVDVWGWENEEWKVVGQEWEVVEIINLGKITTVIAPYKLVAYVLWGSQIFSPVIFLYLSHKD